MLCIGEHTAVPETVCKSLCVPAIRMEYASRPALCCRSEGVVNADGSLPRGSKIVFWFCMERNRSDPGVRRSVSLCETNVARAPSLYSLLSVLSLFASSSLPLVWQCRSIVPGVRWLQCVL